MKDTRQPKLKTIIKEADSVSIGIARLRNKQPQVLFAVKSPTLANRFSVRLYLFSGGQYLKSANDTFGFSCEDKPLTYAGRALDAAILHCMQGTNQWPDKARVLEAAQKMLIEARAQNVRLSPRKAIRILATLIRHYRPRQKLSHLRNTTAWQLGVSFASVEAVLQRPVKQLLNCKE